MAEKHGCGDQARSTARREFLQSHSPHKPLNERDKAAARDEIRKKVGTISLVRGLVLLIVHTIDSDLRSIQQSKEKERRKKINFLLIHPSEILALSSSGGIYSLSPRQNP